MEKKSYNNMYKAKAKAEADVETPAKIMEEASVPVEEAPKKEAKPARKKQKTGTVIGDLNLNLRKEPNGEIVGSFPPGTKVVIAEDANDEWYKITDPSEGYVMKKFIEA